MKTADDVSKAYREGYEQGIFDAIADIPHGVEKGYSVVAVVKCRDCKHLGVKDFAYGYCKLNMSGIVKPNDYCSYGATKESIK